MTQQELNRRMEKTHKAMTHYLTNYLHEQPNPQLVDMERWLHGYLSMAYMQGYRDGRKDEKEGIDTDTSRHMSLSEKIIIP